MAAVTSSMVNASLGGDITPQNFPLLPSHHQLEADDVRTLEADILDGEVLHLAVENCNAAVVRAQRRCDHNPKAVGLPRVNSVG